MVTIDFTIAAGVILDIFLAVWITGVFCQKIDYLKLMTVATSGFFGLYGIIGGFFFGADCFSFMGVLLTEATVLFVMLLFATKRSISDREPGNCCKSLR